MKIGVGAAYYPENCDNDRVRYDADLMKKAGIIQEIYPPEVAVSKRDNFVFLSNFNDSTVEFKTGWKGRNVLGNSLQDGVITLPSRETVVIESCEMG